MTDTYIHAKNLKVVWFFMLCLSSATVVIGQEAPTFYKDIQPIIFRNCTSCHRPGQSGPFPLVSYNDVKKHASMIKQVIGNGYMPPWKADTAYRAFVDQRVLSKEELAAITGWIESGMQLGKKEEAIPQPFENKESNLGKPHLVLTAPEVYTVPDNNRDTFIYSVMHYTLPSDTNVLAFEFVPGDPLAVHHSNTWVFPEPEEYDRIYELIPPEVVPSPILPSPDIPDVYRMYIAFDSLQSAPVGPEFSYPDFFPKVPPLYYDGWVPGATARTWPEGFGFKLPKRGFVIMQIHYGPSPIQRYDQSSINMFFTPTPITRVIESYNIGTGGGIADPVPDLILPPDSVKDFEISVEVADDQSYIALNPHMHYLGKEMKAFAITPVQDTIPLVWIKKWDFRWQEFYKPISPIHIPKGSTVKIFATFDNTSQNPDNRFSPPKRITSGTNSTDEMMSLIVMSVRYNEGDEKILLNSDMPEVKKLPASTIKRKNEGVLK